MDLSYNNALVILAQQSGKGQHSAAAPKAPSKSVPPGDGSSLLIGTHDKIFLLPVFFRQRNQKITALFEEPEGGPAG
jgi:hypothetical protein